MDPAEEELAIQVRDLDAAETAARDSDLSDLLYPQAAVVLHPGPILA